VEVQIFGVRKSADTRAALRFFAERRIKVHFVDLNERAAAVGELRRFAQKLGVAALIVSPPLARPRCGSPRRRTVAGEAHRAPAAAYALLFSTTTHRGPLERNAWYAASKLTVTFRWLQRATQEGSGVAGDDLRAVDCVRGV
jgi:hypothetical protein